MNNAYALGLRFGYERGLLILRDELLKAESVDKRFILTVTKQLLKEADKHGNL